MQTPWGPSQHATPSIPGVVFHSTASHGGFHLDKERQQQFRKVFPWFETFAGGPWYEEDQDCDAVVLAFADEYNDQQVRSSVRSVRCSAKPFNFGTSGNPSIQRYPKWEAIVDWLSNTPAGKQCDSRAAAWENEHAELWERGSVSSLLRPNPDHLWNVWMHRIKDNAKRHVVMEYPRKVLYTTAELDSLPPYVEPQPAITQKAYATTHDGDYGGAFDGFGVYSDADSGL